MISINLDVQQIDQILGALAEQPFRAVADLIANIRAQAIAQLQEREKKQTPPAEG